MGSTDCTTLSDNREIGAIGTPECVESADPIRGHKVCEASFSLSVLWFSLRYVVSTSPQSVQMTQNWRGCQRHNFRASDLLPGAQSIGCWIFPKKSKMRCDCYLLYFRLILTSKSDLKIDQKSFKNQSGYKHPNLLSIFNILSLQNKHLSKNDPKRVPKQ